MAARNPRLTAILLLTSIVVSVGVFIVVGYLSGSRPVLWVTRGVASVLAVGFLSLLIRLGYGYEWTGFGQAPLPKSEAVEIRPKKTVWDWMNLLIVPAVLALGTIAFTLYQDHRQTRIEDERALSERRIEEQRAQDVALQEYLDQMSSLLLDDDRPLRQSTEGSEEARILARARTLTVLTRLKGQLGTPQPEIPQPGVPVSFRRGSVLQFLYEAHLIGHMPDQKPNEGERIPAVISLAGADLSGSMIQGRTTKLSLRGVDLHDTYLHGAILEGADLRDADLSGAFLGRANLSFTDLRDADLSGAFLIEADLNSARLGGVDLSDAHLIDADLSDAFVEADIKLNSDGSWGKGTTIEPMTPAEVEDLGNKNTNLEGATMPDGSKHP